MKVRFFREKGFDAHLTNPQGEALGVFLEMSMGLEAPVDAESGMTVNLVHIDRLLKELTQECAQLSDVAMMLQSSFAKAAVALKAYGAELVELTIRHDDKSWVLHPKDAEWIWQQKAQAPDRQGKQREVIRRWRLHGSRQQLPMDPWGQLNALAKKWNARGIEEFAASAAQEDVSVEEWHPGLKKGRSAPRTGRHKPQ